MLHWGVCLWVIASSLLESNLLHQARHFSIWHPRRCNGHVLARPCNGSKKNAFVVDCWLVQWGSINWFVRGSPIGLSCRQRRWLVCSYCLPLAASVSQGWVETIDREVGREKGCEGLFEVDGRHWVELGSWRGGRRGAAILVESMVVPDKRRWIIPRPLTTLFFFPCLARGCYEDGSPKGKERCARVKLMRKGGSKMNWKKKRRREERKKEVNCVWLFCHSSFYFTQGNSGRVGWLSRWLWPNPQPLILKFEWSVALHSAWHASQDTLKAKYILAKKKNYGTDKQETATAIN